MLRKETEAIASRVPRVVSLHERPRRSPNGCTYTAVFARRTTQDVLHQCVAKTDAQVNAMPIDTSCRLRTRRWTRRRDHFKYDRLITGSYC